MYRFGRTPQEHLTTIGSPCSLGEYPCSPCSPSSTEGGGNWWHLAPRGREQLVLPCPGPKSRSARTVPCAHVAASAAPLLEHVASFAHLCGMCTHMQYAHAHVTAHCAGRSLLSTSHTHCRCTGALPMPCPCPAHALPMPCPCPAHALPMPCPCPAHTCEARLVLGEPLAQRRHGDPG